MEVRLWESGCLLGLISRCGGQKVAQTWRIFGRVFERDAGGVASPKEPAFDGGKTLAGLLPNFGLAAALQIELGQYQPMTGVQLAQQDGDFLPKIF